jgi:3-hydroxybutyryl-CoA dehydrogenase
MNILVVGEQRLAGELKRKFGTLHNYVVFESARDASKSIDKHDVIFDLIIDEDPSQVEVYRNHPGCTVFFNTTLISLHELAEPGNGRFEFQAFGFNGFPTMIDRPIMEVSVSDPGAADKLKTVCAALQTEFEIVADAVGLVTPRVVCMIINEAYMTFEEGIATKEDIDVAMKLGTNYPYGPFEWATRIGINHICELLEAVGRATGDSRYNISPMLMSEYKLAASR